MLSANRAGYALAITSAAFYALCSLVFVAWPVGYMDATTMLFHGFTFNALPHVMSFGGFVLGILCIAILGYIVGAAFAAIWNALSPDRRSLHVGRPVTR